MSFIAERVQIEGVTFDDVLLIPAYMAKKQGKKCLVIDKRTQLGGNIYLA